MGCLAAPKFFPKFDFFQKPFAATHLLYQTNLSNTSLVNTPIPKRRRRIHPTNTRLADLVTYVDFMVADDCPSHSSPNHTQRTVFDELKLTFLIVEYVATFELSASNLLQVFATLEPTRSTREPQPPIFHCLH